jgi:hypothetical protein
MLSRQRGIASYCNDRQFVMLGRQVLLIILFSFSLVHGVKYCVEYLYSPVTTGLELYLAYRVESVLCSVT